MRKNWINTIIFGPSSSTRKKGRNFACLRSTTLTSVRVKRKRQKPALLLLLYMRVSYLLNGLCSNAKIFWVNLLLKPVIISLIYSSAIACVLCGVLFIWSVGSDPEKESYCGNCSFQISIAIEKSFFQFGKYIILQWVSVMSLLVLWLFVICYELCKKPCIWGASVFSLFFGNIKMVASWFGALTRFQWKNKAVRCVLMNSEGKKIKNWVWWSVSVVWFWFGLFSIIFIWMNLFALSAGDYNSVYAIYHCKATQRL